MDTEIKFPITDQYGITEISQAQHLLFQNALEIRDILFRSGIKFSLAFGTMLGAYRHGGFIPWDDDFDYYVADEDYEEAIECLKLNLPDHLIVHSKDNDDNYFHNWVRIKDLRTEVRGAGYYHPDNELLKYKCLSIDLYRLTKLKETEVSSYIESEAKAFWTKKLSAGIIDRTGYDSAIKDLDSYVCAKVRGLSVLSESQYYRYCIVKTDFLLPDSVFFPSSRINFRNEKFPAPAIAERYLTASFGNYMALPAYEQRRSRLTSFKRIDR